MDLDRARVIYKDRFADAGDFTFVFVGNIDLGKLELLVTTYLASLPTKKRKETWKDVGVKWPVGMHSKVVERGREPKSQVMLAFHGKERWSRDAENDLQMLGEVLRIRLRETLREELGGVYGVGAGGGLSRRPRQEYTFTVNFGCAPDNVEALKQRVLADIAVLQKDGIGPDYLEKVKQARRRARELDPSNTEVSLAQARLYSLTGRTSEARATLEQVRSSAGLAERVLQEKLLPG